MHSSEVAHASFPTITLLFRHACLKRIYFWPLLFPSTHMMTHGCNLFAEQPRRTTAEKLHGWEIFSSKSKPFENHRHNSSNHVSWIHLNTVVLNGPHEYWAFNRCGYIAKNNCMKRRCNLLCNSTTATYNNREDYWEHSGGGGNP